MPELPEVETVRRTLELHLLDETIDSVHVYYDKMLSPNKDEFINKLPNQTFRSIKRYGKYLFFIFDDYSIISHLRMEGKYFIRKLEKPYLHEHIIFVLKSGKTLRYHDVRKFGTMKLVHTTDMNEIFKEVELAKLGKEANDTTFTKEELYAKIHKLNTPIKTVLLDQEVLCGLGNIYVDEVCFKCGFHPLRLASTLTIDDCEMILKSSIDVLNYAIECGGTTIRSYTSSLGVTGRFQLNLNVHTQVGKPCKVCNTIIQKIKVGGRGTYFCPVCQQKNPLIIGVTGGISSGKSSVTEYLKEHYSAYTYIDTDEITHNLLQDNKIIETIKNNFGIEVIENNQINRKILGSIIFHNGEKRELLNSIIHPQVIKEVKRLIKKSNSKIIFVSVPLLIEANMEEMVDEIWYIYVNKETQIDRLMKRDNISYDYALTKVNSQMSDEEKRKILSKKQNVVLIDNSSDLCYTYQDVENLMKQRGK